MLSALWRAACLSVLVAACTTHSGAGSTSVVQSWDVDASRHAVWEAGLAALSQAGFEVEEAIPVTGTITTARRLIEDGSGYASCREPYWARVRITVGEGTTGTRLEISPSFLRGEDAADHACSTTGELERVLSRRVIEMTQ